MAALRLNSSVVKWYEKAGNVRKDKLPVAGGDRFVGLVMLFSTETGEPQEVKALWDDLPVLSQLVSGEIAGRQDRNAITCFCNNVGLGLQFAAVGSEALKRARKAGVGRELSTDWFLESVHP